MSLAPWLGGSEGSGEEEQGLGEYLLDHMKDSPEWHVGPFHIPLPKFPPIEVYDGMSIDMSITGHVLALWVGAAIMIGMFYFAFRKKELVPTGFAAMLESLVLFIRDEIAINNMGEKHGKEFTPLLSTLFLFILILNLIGMVPIFTTATSNFSVTMGLAVIMFLTVNRGGIRENGVVGHVLGLVPHVPWFLWPLMFVIEVFGFLIKHFVLAVRLFANMTAGHTVILALLGLIIAMHTYLIAPISIGLALFISVLEILVAFIQAYVFTMLSAVFLGAALHPDH